MWWRGTSAVLGAVGVCLMAAAADAGRGPACEPDPATSSSFRPDVTTRGLLCLINTERAARGLGPLRTSTLLRRSAGRHARDLVARVYFSHVTPEGARPRDRIRRTGYLDGAVSWRVGEVLGYGEAVPQAAQHIQRGFMRSYAHRRLILHRRFDAVGIALQRGWPVAGKETPGVTVVVNLGYAVRGRCLRCDT